MDELSELELSTQKCILCDKYLTIFPIFLHRRGGICGRCTIPTDLENEVLRNYNYEYLAKLKKFPCIYQQHGCLARLIPSNMKEHENSCKFRQYSCPDLNKICAWKGGLGELLEHYEENHQGLVLTDSQFEVDLINNYEENYLLPHGENLFVIHIRFDQSNKVFLCSVHSLGPDDKFKNFWYHFDFVKHFSERTYSLPKKSVILGNFMTFNESDSQSIYVKELKEKLQDPISVICTINIYQENSVSPSLTEKIENKVSEIDDKLLRILECPVCNEYMVAPIHQCLKGHSICSACKDQIKECPTCRSEIGDTRNFHLEEMTQHIDYICKYVDFGCTHKGKANSIKEHEANCKFGPYSCPFDGFFSCNWKGAWNEIVYHSRKEHSEYIMELPTVTYLCDDLDKYEDDDCLIFTAYGQTFRLSFSYRNTIFSWTVQLVGPVDEAKKYMFELDFVDNSNKGLRFYVKRECSPYTAYEEAFNKENEVLRIERDLLLPLIAKGDLTYSCHVFEA